MFGKKDKTASIDKILVKLEGLIAEVDTLKTMNYDCSEADLWERSAKTLLSRIGNESHIKDFKGIFSPIGGPLGSIDMAFEQKYYFEHMELGKNLLIAVKDDIEFFKDEDLQNTASKIKKSFGLKGKIPGFAEAEYKAEDKD